MQQEQVVARELGQAEEVVLEGLVAVGGALRGMRGLWCVTGYTGAVLYDLSRIHPLAR